MNQEDNRLAGVFLIGVIRLRAQPAVPRRSMDSKLRQKTLNSYVILNGAQRRISAGYIVKILLDPQNDR